MHNKKNHEMKKIILFSAGELVYVLVVSALLSAIAYILAVVSILGLSLESLTSTWIAGLILVILSLDLWVISKKVTSFSSNPGKVVIIYRDGTTPEKYQKPVWGKFYYKIIYFPKDWSAKIVISYSIKVVLEVEVLGRNVCFPCYLKLEIGDYSDVKTLNKILLMQDVKADKKIFYFNKCLQHIFTNCNLIDGRKEELENLATQLFRVMADKENVFDRISEKLIFPNDIFWGNVSVTLLRDEIKAFLFDREEQFVAL